MHPVAANSYYSSCSLSIYNTNMLVSLPSHIHKIHEAISGTLWSASWSQCPFTNSLHKGSVQIWSSSSTRLFKKKKKKEKKIQFQVLKSVFDICTVTLTSALQFRKSLAVRTQVVTVEDGPQSVLLELKREKLCAAAPLIYLQAKLDRFVKWYIVLQLAAESSIKDPLSCKHLAPQMYHQF